MAPPSSDWDWLRGEIVKLTEASIMKEEAGDSEADAASTTGLNTWQIDPMSSDFLVRT